MTKGERIKQLREFRAIPQIELAQRIGVSKQSLHKYENNIVTNIPSDKIELLAKYLDVSPAYIMGWTTEPHSNEAFKVTEHEQKLITAYRRQPTMQEAVDKLLGVEQEQKQIKKLA